MNSIASFGPLGTPEMMIIAILVLVFFGAKKLPTFAKSLGRSMGEFRKAKEEFERELRRSIDRRDQDGGDAQFDEEPGHRTRSLPRTFRQPNSLRGANLVVVVLMIVCALLFLAAIARHLGG